MYDFLLVRHSSILYLCELFDVE